MHKCGCLGAQSVILSLRVTECVIECRFLNIIHRLLGQGLSLHPEACSKERLGIPLALPFPCWDSQSMLLCLTFVCELGDLIQALVSVRTKLSPQPCVFIFIFIRQNKTIFASLGEQCCLLCGSQWEDSHLEQRVLWEGEGHAQKSKSL